MPRILLVEDDAMNRALFARRLQRVGYEVVQTGNGREALELAFEVAPDLVIIDLGRPAIDGWEVTRRLRAAPQTRPIPVIALAARPVLGDRERAIQAGCDEYETRPLDLPRLLAKIEALLWKPAAPEPASADGDTFVLPLRPTKPPRPAEQARPAPPSPGPG